MRRHTLEPRDLFALSIVAVFALALMSSPDGTEALTFAEMEPDGTSVVVCTIQRCRPSDNGWVMNLTDTAGGRIDAFCRYGDVDGIPLNGSAVRIWAQPSEDDPSFLFISRMDVLPLPDFGQISSSIITGDMRPIDKPMKYLGPVQRTLCIYIYRLITR